MTAMAVRGVFARHDRQPLSVAPADRPAPLVAEANGERGFVIARRLGGERALPQAGSLLFLSSERLTKHLLVCGATGSGKTETLLRLAWTVARESDAPVFYLDAKGDERNAERFCGLMADVSHADTLRPT